MKGFEMKKLFALVSVVTAGIALLNLWKLLRRFPILTPPGGCNRSVGEDVYGGSDNE